ncbi:MAG: hypothetical protein AB7J13_07160 [Pyrinomonadaceae bacterium]
MAGSELPAKEDFSAALNQTFQVAAGDGSVFDLVLSAINSHVSSEQQENFSLLFRGPVEAPAKQGTYRLENEELGSMDIFLVPVKKDEAGLYFEAVFNQFREAAAR